MADITVFPTIQNVQYSGPAPIEFTATEAITKGMVVGFAASGVSKSVVPMDATADEQCIGVATSSALAGAKVLVALDGSIAKVANADADTNIDAGDYVELNDNAVLGTVSTLALTQFTANHYVVGIAIDAIVGAGTGNILVQVGVQVSST